MKLPNGHLAIVTMEKLKGYCLNTEHSSGKHKAKIFASALGITSDNAGELKALITQDAVEGDVVQQLKTAYGQLFKVDWLVPSSDQIVLRTLWEIKSDNAYPRLVSAFIK